MSHRFSREELLLGQEKLDRLKSARIAVFGAGGVGSYVIEALARSGVGALDVIDGDTVSLTNCNRQLFALSSTLGLPKAEVARQRVLDINPECSVTAVPRFFTAETAPTFDLSPYDYIADAIDMVTSKLLLISMAKEADVPVISCMGTGNKFDPTAFRVADISETTVCPLARVMRKELKRRGIDRVKAVFSTEEAKAPLSAGTGDAKAGSARKVTPGSTAFVPGAAGLLLAAEIVKDLTGFSEET